jgi:hypothetical protein
MFDELSQGEIDWIVRKLRERYIQRQAKENPMTAADPHPLTIEDCRKFMWHIACERPLPDSARDWLQSCFSLAAQGGSLDKLLGLNRSKGRQPKQETLDKHFGIAVAVAQRMGAGETLEKAAEEVGKQFGMYESRVQDAYAKYKSDAEFFLALESLLLND